MTIRLLVLGGALVGVLILALGAAVVLTGAERDLEESVGQTVRGQARSLSQTIDRDLVHRIEALRAYARTSTEIQVLLRVSNSELSGLGSPDRIRAEIDRRDLEWTQASAAETPPLMARVLGHPVSGLLREMQRFYRGEYGYEVYGEIFLSNRHGATVAETGRTSDYRQDDEGWWQTAFREGLAVSDPEHDESAGLVAVEVAVRIDDAAGAPVGVLKAVLNVAEIEGILADFVARSGYETVVVELQGADGETLVRHAKGGIGRGRVARSRQGSFRSFERVWRADGAESIRTRAVSEGYRGFTGRGWTVELEIGAEEALAAVADGRRAMLGVGLAATVLAGLFALSVAGFVSRHLRQAIAVADRLAQGDLGFEVGESRIAEVSSLLRSMGGMLANVRIAIRSMLESSRQGSATAERLVEVSREVAETATSQAGAAEGLATPVEEMAASMVQAAGSSGRVAAAVDSAVASVEEMAASIQGVAGHSEELGAAVQQTLERMEAIVVSVRQVAEQSVEARTAVAGTLEVTATGSAAVGDTVEAMKRILGSMGEIATTVQRLEKASRRIDQIVEVLDGISSRIHLLALNAAIQAAHAGEQGKGFAVVAHEVSVLADQSTESTRRIAGILAEFQQDVGSAIEVARSGSDAVVRGVDLAEASGEDLERIRATTEALSVLVEAVSRAMERQAAASEEVVGTFERMRGLTEQVRLANRDQAEGTRHLLERFSSMNSLAGEVSAAMEERSRGKEEILRVMRKLLATSATGQATAGSIVELSHDVRLHAARLRETSAFFAEGEEPAREG